MTGILTYHVGRQLIDDRLRVAVDRQSASLVTGDNHELQRAGEPSAVAATGPPHAASVGVS